MKLPRKDIKILLSLGCGISDIERIEKSLDKMIFYLVDGVGDMTQIDKDKARRILGDTKFLSGVRKCTFDRSSLSALETSEDGIQSVLFDLWLFYDRRN